MVPRNQLELMGRTSAVACTLALSGDVARGYELLLARLSLARAASDPWKEELTALYESALRCYRSRYPLPRDPVSQCGVPQHSLHSPLTCRKGEPPKLTV
ncbi:MAG: hypothetical protein K0Q72_4529 [Armatimonadetes bacterium]|jgi:hypothetical protein|nr:hypothetical protein [Armatimonadota bacterium]